MIYCRSRANDLRGEADGWQASLEVSARTAMTAQNACSDLVETLQSFSQQLDRAWRSETALDSAKLQAAGNLEAWSLVADVQHECESRVADASTLLRTAGRELKEEQQKRSRLRLAVRDLAARLAALDAELEVDMEEWASHDVIT
eukprot:TRINITY_DN33403_c0_g2_i1.p1 TRINITY_DN33403_c0_g2~~TRINITY_DN33403_c0_g2_i1.p1  ORF type:complete len:145 (-),score=31.44 TRINITY_DN33403_c0_g2_i1:26-460(-)